MQPLVTEVHALRQQMGAVQANLESLVRQQVVLTPQVSFLQNGEGLVPKEAVTCSKAHKLLNRTNVSSSDHVVLLPTSVPVGVLPGCMVGAAPMGATAHDEPHRVPDGLLPIKMVFPCYGGPQDDKDPFVFLQKCNDFLSLRVLSHSEVLATMNSMLHGSARDWWETVRGKVHTWEEFQGAFLSPFLPEDYADVLV